MPRSLWSGVVAAVPGANGRAAVVVPEVCFITVTPRLQRAAIPSSSEAAAPWQTIRLETERRRQPSAIRRLAAVAAASIAIITGGAKMAAVVVGAATTGGLGARRAAAPLVRVITAAPGGTWVAARSVVAAAELYPTAASRT